LNEEGNWQISAEVSDSGIGDQWERAIDSLVAKLDVAAGGACGYCQVGQGEG